MKPYHALVGILLGLMKKIDHLQEELSGGSEPVTGEQKLLRHLMRSYDPAVRPVVNASDPVDVRVGLTLINILEMDEKNQILVTSVWLDQEWTDDLLMWEPSEFGNIRAFRIPCAKIWTPDIVLYNNADDYTRGYYQSRAMIHANGYVFWPTPTQLRSTCKIDVTFFPFDSQHCYLKFGSWTYNGFEVNTTNRSANADMSNYILNGEFEMVSVHQIRRNIVYPCCPEPYPDVVYFFHIRRKVLYYMLNVVLPCAMMSMLTLLVYCLPPDSGEKIGLGITVLLAFSVFGLQIAEKVPETSESVPLIGIYLTIIMGMTGFSVVMTVLVLNFHHQGPFRAQVPHWVRLIILGHVRRFLGMRFPDEGGRGRADAALDSEEEELKASKLRDGATIANNNSAQTVDETAIPLTGLRSPRTNPRPKTALGLTLRKYRELKQRKLSMDCSVGRGAVGSSLGLANNLMFQMVRANVAAEEGGGRRKRSERTEPKLVNDNLRRRGTVTEEFYRQSVLGANTHLQAEFAANQLSRSSSGRRPKKSTSNKTILEDEVLKTLHMLISRQQLDDECEEMCNEWRQVATVCDRLLFWLFLLGNLLATMVLLVAVPLINKDSDAFDISKYNLP